ncbi:MAG: DNA gyrase subunit A, partial [Eubacterium sp.]|nr:DNA gyrase subunit A [Eubacterium sp.]
REKLQNEYDELERKIKELEEILSDEKVLLGVIRKEILVIRDKFGDDRRTSIEMDVEDLSDEALIPRKDTVITFSKLGYIKRMTPDNFHSQNRGGKGIRGMNMIEEDNIDNLFMTSTHNFIMFFTNKGRVYRLKGYEIPEAGRTARGVNIINLLQLQPDEKITAIIPLEEDGKQHYLVMATKRGLIKKTGLDEYKNIRKTGLAAISLREEDELIEVKQTDENEDIFLVSKEGQCIRFHLSDVRETGRVSMGVIGMKIDDSDEIIGMPICSEGEDLLIVSEKGMGKRTPLHEFSVQHRGGKGLRCYKITEKTGNVIGAKTIKPEEEIMLITTEGIVIRMKSESISIIGRNTSGVKLINIDSDSDVRVASVAKVKFSEEDLENQDIPEKDEAGNDTEE